jgi:hypothetical protein
MGIFSRGLSGFLLEDFSWKLFACPLKAVFFLFA